MCVCVCACVCLSLCVLYVSRCIYIWALRHSREGGCVLCLGMYLCVLYVFIYIGALRHSGGGAAHCPCTTPPLINVFSNI